MRFEPHEQELREALNDFSAAAADADTLDQHDPMRETAPEWAPLPSDEQAEEELKQDPSRYTRAKPYNLPYTMDKDGVSYKLTPYNIARYLHEEPVVQAMYDEFVGEITIKGKSLEESDVIDIRMQMLHDEKWNRTKLATNAVYEGIVATATHFHSVLDYLKSLQWDGKPRLDTIFIDLFGADDNIYTRETAQLMFLGMLERVHHPGIKYDYVVVLQSRLEGTGKTTFLEKIGGVGGNPWYTSISAADLTDDKRLGEKLQGRLIADYDELDGINKASASSLKTAITRCKDVYRASYAKGNAQSRPRTCILSGTTNFDKYLTVPGDHRRFLPIMVKKKGILSDDDAIQLWAEAYHRYMHDGYTFSKQQYDNGSYTAYKLVLSSEAEELANGYRAKVTDIIANDYADAIERYVTETNLAEVIAPKTIYEAHEAGLSDLRYNEARGIIRYVMVDVLGWEDFTQKTVYVSQMNRSIRGYKRP